MAGVTKEAAVSEKTMVIPATNPGVLSGTITRQNTCQAEAPSVAAASSSAGFMRDRADASGSTIIGKKTCSEPITTAVSLYSSRTATGPKPNQLSAQLITPALLLARR